MASNSPFIPDTGASVYAQGLLNKSKPPVNRADVDTVLKEYKLTGFKAKGRSDRDLRTQAVRSVIEWWKNQQRAREAAQAGDIAGSQPPSGGGGVSAAGGGYASAPAPAPRIVSRATLAKRAAATGAPTTTRNVSAATKAKRNPAPKPTTTNRSAPSKTTGGTAIQRPTGRGFTELSSVTTTPRRTTPLLRGGLLRF